MKHKMYLIAVLFLISTYSLFGQKPMEEDPNVMWTYGNASFSTYPAVHPNGNVLIGDKIKGDVIEINGLTGELVRRIPVPVSDIDPNQIAISKDGTRLIIAKKVVDYTTGSVIAELPEITSIVKFLNPSNNLIVIRPYNQKEYSWIVWNINEGTSNGYNLSTFITSIDVSSDGRFLALASKETSLPINDQRTHFYIYDAQTMKLIRELEDVAAEGRIIEFIQFSENAKYVGYGHKLGGTPKGTFFNCEPPYKKWEYLDNSIDVHAVSFIKDDFAILGAGGAAIIWDINLAKNIFKTFKYGAPFLIYYNNIYNSLLTFNSQSLALTSLNFDIILGVDNERNKPSIYLEYSNGLLKIFGYEGIHLELNVTINDIKGNIVFQNGVNQVSDKIELPVKLQNGVYILQIQGGKKNYSQKFIVTE